MRRILNDNRGFSFIIPLTITIIIGFAVMAVGGYLVGEVDTVLEDTYPTNTKTGYIDVTYWHNATTNATRNITLTAPNTAEQLSGTVTKFYILANGSFPIYYNLTVNGVAVNTTSQLAKSQGYNHTLTALISGGSVKNGNNSLDFHWDVNSTESQIQIRVYGIYYASGDLRTNNQNETISLLGNITGGFGDVVDVEIIAIIITALAMAILTIMAVGTRRGMI